MMLNFKRSLLAVLCSLLLYGCGAPGYLFDHNRIITDKIIDNVWSMAGGTLQDSVRKIHLFKATIQEKLVENNAVAEYKLMNTLSDKKSVDLAINRYYNELYFYEIRAKGQSYGILLAATFEGSDTCIGIGPLYIGGIGVSSQQKGVKKFVAEREYRIVKESAKRHPVISKKATKPGLVFSYTTEMNLANDPTGIRVFEVVQKNKNKISGMHKPVVYDVEKIFNDPAALKFSRIK